AKAMAKEPPDRFADAGEMLAALEGIPSPAAWLGSAPAPVAHAHWGQAPSVSTGSRQAAVPAGALPPVGTLPPPPPTPAPIPATPAPIPATPAPIAHTPAPRSKLPLIIAGGVAAFCLLSGFAAAAIAFFLR